MVIVEGGGGVGEEAREVERARRRECGGEGSRGSLTVAAFPLLHGNGEEKRSAHPPRVRLSRTEPEAHSQADGPYTSA